MQRSAGILLPVSSLPSPYGIGCFSQEAYDFVDWLKDAGQTYWQILPLGVTSYGDSPYQSFSAFAGNPYFTTTAAMFCSLPESVTRYFISMTARATMPMMQQRGKEMSFRKNTLKTANGISGLCLRVNGKWRNRR